MEFARLAGSALAVAVPLLAAADSADPWVDRIEPLGGQRGSVTDVVLVGTDLAVPAVVEFDSPHLSWETVALEGKGRLAGRIRVGPEAPLGPHIATAVTPDGRVNSRMFYVDEFASTLEAEPNDTPGQAQQIELAPQTLHGAMHELPDIDVFAFEAGAGDRWTFDLRSLEYGGFLENNMALLDADGVRVAFSDDRDDYLETPFLEHTFERGGRYFLRLDQYRGPQRVNCNRNCGYMLRIGQLPVVEAAHPLGARPGSVVEISVRGRALSEVQSVWLAPVRRGEYYRLTFPYTIPLRTDHDGSGRVEGRIESQADRLLGVRFEVPDDAWRGLWRLWVRSPGGVVDAVSLEISDMPEADCSGIRPSRRGTACHGVLEKEGAVHAYGIELRPGQPMVATTLAAQLGVPYLDTVLELFDADGELVAEHDDLMTGQGTVIGNPDSLLHYRSADGGRYRLVVRDRIGRGGPDMAYRLRVEEREPGFALLSDPESLNIRPGSRGRLGVLLVPEPGFGSAVETWIEDPPPGVSASPGRFRSDQFFGPSGDGDNVVIPTAHLDVDVSADLAPGDYPLRVLGRTAGDTSAVEAISTLWIGPPRMRNDVRRPLPAIRLTVLGATAEKRESGAKPPGTR